MLERIERDAYILWQVMSSEQRQACSITAGSFNDPIVADLTTLITAAGLRLCLFDITSDIGTARTDGYRGDAPVALSGRDAWQRPHLNRVRAAIRAITEAAQSRLTFISGARDDIHPSRLTQTATDGIPSNALQSIRLASLSHRCRNCPVPRRF
jgi:ribosomal protein S12 methylthiotransferase accessory factor YcaO